MNWPRISIVVVNKDLGNYLKEALESIVSQGYPNLELLVVDGGSTDNSVEVIEQYAEAIQWWVSEKDAGQYEAIEKGFAHSTGEIMGWLNSDDKYMPRGLFELATMFQTFPDVEWIQGFPMEYTATGGIQRRIAVPWARWSRYRYLTYDFQFIQQESTFWKRTLWEKAGGHLSKEARLAGDMELWARFFRHAKLYTSLAILSGFRHRGEEQRSRAGADQYMAEAVAVIDRERSKLNSWQRFWLSVRRVALFPFGVCFYLDIPLLRTIYRKAYKIPPIIAYDFDNKCYTRERTMEMKHPPLLWKEKQVRRPARKNTGK